jgi:Ca2+-binding EF-hand superfamily protein
MSSKKDAIKEQEEQPTLRRSSRSTRGSVKPVVDLTKKVVEEEEDEEAAASEEQEEEEEEDVKPKRSNRRSSVKAAPARKTAVKRGPNKKAVAKQEPADAETKVKDEKQEEKHDETMAADQDNGTVVDLDDKSFLELNEKEMKEVNNAFDMNRLSEDDEVLNADGVRTAMRSMGFEPRGDEIKRLMKKFANKKSGNVTRNGFHKIMAYKYCTTPLRDNRSNDEISRVFNLLDLDRTGLITLDNLKSISKELNEELTEEDLREMISEADQDGDFKINKDEFHNIMKKTSLY